MQTVNYEEAVERILAHDPRYAREAYLFLREALEFTQKQILKANKGKVRHVTAKELLDGLRQYALQQFGPMTVTVFEDWGVNRCQDFGEMVFNLVECGLFEKTDKDSREDFQPGYDFTEAFRKPFWPLSRLEAEAKIVVG